MTSILKVDNIQNSSGTSSMSIASNGLVIPPAGGIIQTQYTQFTGTNTYSTTAATDAVITDLTVNITPVSTSSIIRIDAMVNGEWSNQAGATDGVWFFYRDATKLSHSAAGNRNVGIRMGSFISYNVQDNDSTPEGTYYSYFDAPTSTSQITYKVGVNSASGFIYYLNRTISDTDLINYERGTSFICVTEIAG